MSRLSFGIPFRANAAAALKNASLIEAMRTSTSTFTEKRAEGVAKVPFEQWREEASRIRTEVLDNLPQLIDRFAAAATRAGSIVHRARDAEAAREIVGSILKDRGVRTVVKAKSMVTEEIHLNQYLESMEIRPVETDLGEYIVQIAGEKPSHILAPALHKNRRDIGKLFAEKLGIEYTDDPEVLTKVARRALREEFISADAGLSGVNLAAADTGSIAIFTNEGNGRMVTTLPPIHVAVMTMEKIIPSLADLSLFIRLLPRSATGQTLSSYFSLITGTRKAGEATGARELHIVIVDNGRSRILQGEFRDILKCIRCSACLNVCPVFRAIGGHAYGSTYPGPMGIVLTTLLDGMEKAHPILDGSTLCGACTEVCPVKVPLAGLIASLRRQKVELGFADTNERIGMAGFGMAAGSPSLFAFSQSMAHRLWSVIQRLGRNSAVERLPRPVEQTFRRRMS